MFVFRLNFCSSAPPPPPINGSIPVKRIQTQPQPEMPSCVQNAMMTKDKKPFTYTPGGIDLSQIKSPRMAQRISRNANMEGVTNQPRPSPLAQVNFFDVFFLQCRTFESLKIKSTYQTHELYLTSTSYNSFKNSKGQHCDLFF